MRFSTKEAFTYFGGAVIGATVLSNVINRVVGEDMSKKSMNVSLILFHMFHQTNTSFLSSFVYCLKGAHVEQCSQNGEQRQLHTSVHKEWIQLVLDTEHHMSQSTSKRIKRNNNWVLLQ